MVAGDNNSAMVPGFIVSRMDPSEVLNLAGEFVVQYYTVMRKCPSGLHRFYKDDSAMIRENATVFGQKMIHEKIMSMNVGNSRVGILRLDALRANGNSVLIQVSGEVSFGGADFRRFMQSFVLCEQAPCDFYVVNDIFRYQDHVYGDAKVDEIVEAEPEAAAPEPSVDFSNAGVHKPLASNGETEVNVSSWENTLQTEVSYPKPTGTPIEPHGVTEREEVEAHEDEGTTHEHQAPLPTQSPVAPRAVPQVPPVDSAQPSSPQPRSWAYMASKQPSHTVLSMQSAKPPRASMPTASVQNFDDSNKAARAPANATMNSRPRGGGRQGDSRIASGDHGYTQENRPTGQGGRMSGGRGGPMGSGMRGGAGGGRGGGRGGMGTGGTGNSFGGRGAAGASMPRRGQ